jgi:putative membrane protein|tara:strand:+ start:1607 stop:1957 length:351 start_codon:yes stop_codon:yes gene_type:complete
MRYLRYLVFGSIAVGLVIVALANRGEVSLTLMPLVLGDLIGFNLQLQIPLFTVIFLGVMAGLLIGFVWEWLREMKHRTAAKTEHRQVVRLEREVSKLKSGTAKEQDDILALLEKVS